MNFLGPWQYCTEKPEDGKLVEKLSDTFWSVWKNAEKTKENEDGEDDEDDEDISNSHTFNMKEWSSMKLESTDINSKMVKRVARRT